MTRCFADTFFYLALLNRDDEAHQRAREYVEIRQPELVTTAWILTEVANTICRSARRNEFGELFESVLADDATTFIPATDALFRLGVDRYVRRPDKHWSLTDCISFIVMEQNGLTDALTGDHHFEQAGFRTLLRNP